MVEKCACVWNSMLARSHLGQGIMGDKNDQKNDQKNDRNDQVVDHTPAWAGHLGRRRVTTGQWFTTIKHPR